MRSIVVTGAGGPLAHRVLDQLGRDGVTRVEDAGAGFGECDTVINLGWEPGAARSSGPADAVDAGVAGTTKVLGAAADAGARSVVHLSSAVVYGAWSDNAIPLTEEAALRPNPGVADAVRHAEAERVVADWADAHPETRVSVLRPATVLGSGVESWLARALGGRSTLRPRHLDPPRQFVHVDDLAAALVVAASDGLVGVFNVAADGWIGGEQLRVLGAGGPTLAVPRRIAGAVAAWTWNLHLSTLPPEVIPLIELPWVVANDRLRGAGWIPAHTNEEAVVAGTSGSRWREMSPSRRQELALAGSAVAVLGGMAGAVGAVRARRR